MYQKRLSLLLLSLSYVAACSSADQPSLDGAPKACLDQPGQLPRPPQNRLPCELLRPGLSLAR